MRFPIKPLYKLIGYVLKYTKLENWLQLDVVKADRQQNNHNIEHYYLMPKTPVYVYTLGSGLISGCNTAGK